MPKLMKEHRRFDEESSILRENTMSQMNFSTRARDRILKVARTIAGLPGCKDITADHLLERSAAGRWTGICRDDNPTPFRTSRSLPHRCGVKRQSTWPS